MKYSQLLSHACWSIPPLIAFSDILSVVKVDGNSMADTLMDTDLILVDKLTLRWRENPFKRGDVVTLLAPDYPKLLLTKRLIAMDKDIVWDESNNHPVGPLGPGQCWVEGDNRGKGESRDSASGYGPVHLALIQGRAVAIVWPPRRMGLIESRLPQGKVKTTGTDQGENLQY